MLTSKVLYNFLEMITEGCTKKYNKWVGNPSPPVIAATLKKVSYNYGLRHGEGFLISSMRPAMFLRKRLCMFFSSISFSLRVHPCTGAIFDFLWMFLLYDQITSKFYMILAWLNSFIRWSCFQFLVFYIMNIEWNCLWIKD